jgi:hypothetical protein
LPLVVNVVNAPVEAEEAPMVVPSIAPPLMSAVAIVPVVNVPAAAEFAPIVVPSMAPASISTQSK